MRPRSMFPMSLWQPALLGLMLLPFSSSADGVWPSTHVERVGSGDVVCETIHEPVPVRKGVYVLEHYTRCHHEPSESRLETACGVLLETYGAQEGEQRCKHLLTRAARATD